MKNLKISGISRIVILIVGLLFFVSLLFPMWQIELEAPQYPEGLLLQLHANKIGGDVEVINGLNHYIGMKTLHTEDFFEFKILPYIVVFFGVFALLVAFVAKRKWVVILFFSLVSFVALAAVDFYRWNYEYGHNLDPNAAIKVPGMAYQPPILGYKQLLNFGAYSIPDTGGWILILAGTLLFFVVVKETHFLSKWKKKNISAKTMTLLFLGTLFLSCSVSEPEPLKINKDRCDHCEMTISDGRFGGEVITVKGRIYKFDDLFCLLNYIRENKRVKFAGYFINDYAKNNQLIDAQKASFVVSKALKSPMGGNTAAFESAKTADEFAMKAKTSVLKWGELRQQ
ncbi:MAG: nitrous oxide reductase accessory protein NosL [Crocinitomicaceae bacterium]